MKSLSMILQIEDNPDDEQLTLRALQRGKIANEILIARNSEEALTSVFNNVNLLPTVMVLDLRLPKIDELGVLRQIRTHEKPSLLPVVILTSSSEERDIIKNYNFGANSYVPKPVGFDQFIEVVRQLGLY